MGQKKSLIVAGLMLLFGPVNCKNNSPSDSTPDATNGGGSARENALNESMLSPQFKDMRESFLAVNNKSDLSKWLTNLDKNLNKALEAKSQDPKANDYVFTASLATLAIEFESFIYRSVDLVDNYKSLRSMFINWLMLNDSVQKVYLPTKQADALFSYVTEPPEQGAPRAGFSDMAKMQAMLYETAERYKKVYNALAAIKLGSSPLIFDNKLVYGTGAFGDDIKRYYEIGDAELQATLASLAMSIHGIYVFNAYNLDAVPELAQDVGHLFGLDGFRWGDPEGTTTKKKVDLIKKFPQFWTLKEVSGPKDMAAAYKYFALAANHADLAYKSIEKRDNTTDKEVTAFDRFFLNPMRQSAHSIPNRRAVDNLLAMIQGETKVRSQITGEEITINLKQFYQNPPKDMKRLLPIKFVGESAGPEGAQFKQTPGGLKYRNYSWGSPTAWSDQDYKPYLGVTSSTDVQKASRILVQSWGGWLATPLVAMAM